ncbi:MAG: N-acetyltransferase [Flavobacteriales bacterium]|nr:N-acetyltransferase [Flavobacteriales bacterium]
MKNRFEIHHSIPSETLDRGRFFILKKGKKIAELRYVLIESTKTLVLQRIWCSQELKSSGASESLVMSAVNHCRENGWVILSHSPFAQTLFYLNREFEDVQVQYGARKHRSSGIRKLR